jgi:hypothetical protein
MVLPLIPKTIYYFRYFYVTHVTDEKNPQQPAHTPTTTPSTKQRLHQLQQQDGKHVHRSNAAHLSSMNMNSGVLLTTLANISLEIYHLKLLTAYLQIPGFGSVNNRPRQPSR